MDAFRKIVAAWLMMLATMAGLAGAQGGVAEFITQPDAENIFVGGVAGFSVEVASNTTPSFAWQYSPTGATYGDLPVTGAILSGANTSALTISEATQSVQGVYRCAVTNQAGTVFSMGAPLFVEPIPPNLILEPASVVAYRVAGTTFPSAQIIIVNGGGLSLSFNFDAPAVTWHGVPMPNSGLVPPAPSALGVSIPFDSSLAIGVYETLLTINTNALAAEVVAIPITLHVVDAFTVTTLADSGPGSLRAIIDSCNATPGPQTIAFAVSGRIELLSALPSLSDNTGGTIIEGADKITLDGKNLTGVESGLVLVSGGNSVRGLHITGFPANGILVAGLNAVGNSITGCRIGAAGTGEKGNLQSGIRIDDGAQGTIVGGMGDSSNSITGNSFSAISVGRATQSSIRGNAIGIEQESFALVGNGGHGIHFLPRASDRNTFGGTTIFDSNASVGSKFRPASVDVLVGTTVRLRGLAQGPGTLSYRWLRSGTQVGTAQDLVLSNVQKAQEGDYTYEVTNSAGTTPSTRTYVNVLDRTEFLALALLPAYAELDVNADGGISYSEASAFAGRAFAEAGHRGATLSQEEFDAIDTDGDGLLSIAELLAAAEIPMDLVRVTVLPETVDFGARHIDDGPAEQLEVQVANLDSTPLNLVSAPAISGPAAEQYSVVEDDEAAALGFFESRAMTLAFDPAAVNTKAAYLVVRTDDFLLPVLAVPLLGEGFQTTMELLATLIGGNPTPRSLEELDVNADVVFDGADVEANVNAGR